MVECVLVRHVVTGSNPVHSAEENFEIWKHKNVVNEPGRIEF